MLTKLERQDYFKVESLFKELKNQIVIGSVIEGNTCGDVYVDNLENPAFAVLWDKMDAILIEGALNEDYISAFANLVSKILIADAKSRYVPCFNIYYPNENWANLIENKLRDLAPRKERKYFYEFNQLISAGQNSFQNNYVIRRMDENLLKQNDLKNLDKVIGWVKSFWPTTKEFTDKGIGYCLIQEDICMGWCLSVFVSGRKYELGLETVTDYRGKGYAKVAASACIRYCLEHNLTPLWNCDAENEASVHVAEAIGFKKMKEYYVWHLDVK